MSVLMFKWQEHNLLSVEPVDTHSSVTIHYSPSSSNKVKLDTANIEMYYVLKSFLTYR